MDGLPCLGLHHQCLGLALVPQPVPRQRELPVEHLGPDHGGPQGRGPYAPGHQNLPATFTSAVSEWYSWSNDLRQNPDIKILASVDPSSFPLGTDPNQSWYSGYYPILWTNTKYKMLYANFGHNAMDYSTNTRLSSTFASETQNRFVLDGLKWLGGADNTTPCGGLDLETAWYSLTNAGNGTCVDARAAATANGTAIQQYACNGTQAQQFQFRSTDSGYRQAGIRGNPQQVIDVTGVSTADNAPLQLWSYGAGRTSNGCPSRRAPGATTSAPGTAASA